MQESMTSQLVADALMMAVWRRGKPVELLHHSDQGSQYTSEHFQGMCSTTSSVSTTRRVGIQRSGTSVRYSSRKLQKLKGVSTKPAAAHLSVFPSRNLGLNGMLTQQ
jgi:transposase InsO family protein